MQPRDAGRIVEDAMADRKSTLNRLFFWGTATFHFVLLASQVSVPPSRIPQLTVIVAATVLLAAAAFVGQRRMRREVFSEWGFGPLWIIVLVFELAWSSAIIGEFIIREIPVLEITRLLVANR
jgi:hypothetical protein